MLSLFHRFFWRGPSPVALGAIATTGSGSFAATLVEVGLSAATASGSGSDAVTIVKVGALAPATTGQGNEAVVLVDSESVSAISAGQSVVQAALVEIGLLAAATSGATDAAVTLDLQAPIPVSNGGGSDPRLSARKMKAFDLIRPKVKSKTKPPTRRPARIQIAAASSGESDVNLEQLSAVGVLTLATAGASDIQASLEIDELLNDDVMIALSLLAAA